MYCELEETHAVPFEKVLEAVNFMPYGSDVRVMFEMLFLTGCRMAELERMQKNHIIGNRLYWKLGKNQRSNRREILPRFYLRELNYYREHHRVYGLKLFGISTETFRRYFNRDIRPKLSKLWNDKIESPFRRLANQEEFVLQLKGLRKDFQTLDFSRGLKKWKDSGVALEFTSKNMKHSSKRITDYHYLVNFESLNMDKYGEMTPAQILTEANQTRLMDFI